MSELNLISYSLKQKKQKNYQTRQYRALGILALCMFFSGIYFPKMMLAELKVQEASLLNKVTVNKAVLEESKLVSSELASYNQRSQFIDYLSKNKFYISNRIVDFEKYISKDIKLTSLNYTAEGTTLTGTASNYNAVSEFAANLETSKKYKSVKITSITGDGFKSLYHFSISISY